MLVDARSSRSLRLNRLSKEGRWAEMGTLIDQDMLEAFAVLAPLDEIGPALVDRWSDVVSRLSFYTPYQTESGQWDGVIAAIKAA